MPTTKPSKQRVVGKHKNTNKGFTKLASKPFSKQLAKQLPDTTRIPWFPTSNKTGKN